MLWILFIHTWLVMFQYIPFIDLRCQFLSIYINLYAFPLDTLQIKYGPSKLGDLFFSK